MFCIVFYMTNEKNALWANSASLRLALLICTGNRVVDDEEELHLTSLGTISHQYSHVDIWFQNCIDWLFGYSDATSCKDSTDIPSLNSHKCVGKPASRQHKATLTFIWVLFVWPHDELMNVHYCPCSSVCGLKLLFSIKLTAMTENVMWKTVEI